MKTEPTPVFIIGYGDVGRRVAARWMALGAKVRALVRRPIEVKEHLHPCIDLYRGDLDTPRELSLESMSGTRLYYFAPPPGTGKTDARLRGWLRAMGTAPEKIVLISTSGVYGDCGGEWVDETRRPRPGSDRARRRLDAEQAIQEYAADKALPCVVLRVAGIYGPGRLPEKRLQEQTPLPAAEHCGYTNRVHVDDLVEACVLAMQKQPISGVFNVSDGTPGTMREYFDLLADALGYPRLPVSAYGAESSAVSDRMAVYLRESRRVDNTRLLETLGLTLRYPDLSAGLADLSRASSAP